MDEQLTPREIEESIGELEGRLYTLQEYL